MEKESKDTIFPESVTWEHFVEKQEYLLRRISKLKKQVKWFEEQNNDLEDDRDWYEECYYNQIKRFDKLKNAWKTHHPDWDMIDEIAKNIINNTKLDYDKCNDGNSKTTD